MLMAENAEKSRSRACLTIKNLQNLAFEKYLLHTCSHFTYSKGQTPFATLLRRAFAAFASYCRLSSLPQASATTCLHRKAPPTNQFRHRCPFPTLVNHSGILNLLNSC